MKAIVAERGQITIPKLLRQKLGIKPGTVLEIRIQKTALIIIKADQRDPIERVYGCLKKHINTDDVIENLRGKT